MYGIIFLLAGLALRYFVNRRRFNRRSITGMQQYKNYEQAVATTFFEKVLKIVGLALILLGAFLVAGDFL